MKTAGNTVTVKSSDFGFASLLFFLFLGLRLGEVIHWSYWWVTAPLWVPFAFLIVVIGAFAGTVWLVNLLRR